MFVSCFIFRKTKITVPWQEKGCADLNLYQQCARVLVLPCPCQHLRTAFNIKINMNNFQGKLSRFKCKLGAINWRVSQSIYLDGLIWTGENKCSVSIPFSLSNKIQMWDTKMYCISFRNFGTILNFMGLPKPARISSLLCLLNCRSQLELK